MPDYNRKVTLYWWVGVTLGSLLLAHALWQLSSRPWTIWLQTGAGLALAMTAALFPVRVPGTRRSFVAGEIFIFLLLLMHGAQAAAVAAAGEGFVGSLRTSKRWTSRLFSPAAAGIAMLAAGSLLQWFLRAQVDPGSTAGLLAATMVFAALYFVLNAQLVGSVLRLKRGERCFQPGDLFGVFQWVGMAYLGSASIAALLYATASAQGTMVLVVMLPVLLLLLVALHFFSRQQGSSLALRDAQEAAAAREAAAAQRHLLDLQQSEQRFHAAFTYAWIGMALLDFDGRITQANRALAMLLQESEEQLGRGSFIDWVDEADRATFQQRLGLAGGREFEGFTQELRCRARDGTAIWCALHCSFFTEPDAALPRLILQVQDVSARRHAEAGLQQLAFHDPLTGLPNRRRLHECLTGALNRVKVDRRSNFAVMFLDFDRFKLVNDSLGHSTGDRLLVQVARRLQERLRPTDILARLGGDEFAILVDHLEHERDAVLLAERLAEALARPFSVDGLEVHTGASIGITFSALGYTSSEELLRDADTAMYKAKSTGRAEGKAAYAVFDASLHTAVSHRLRLEGELREAVERHQLSVAYQPVVELVTGRISGFEALVRWQHPTRGTIEPLHFLPVAEEAGLMVPLTDFVLHCACQQLRLWHAAGHGELAMSVNVSAHDIAQPILVARVSGALAEAGLRPEFLTLELAESILMSRLDGALTTLTELKRLGVRLAVDDFGTGYSSLAHLARLPIDTLKIDRTFVQQMRRDTDEAAVLHAIVQLGATLRMHVVVEGLESTEQLEQLRAMGCVAAQGFLWSMPVPAEAAAALLQASPDPMPLESSS